MFRQFDLLSILFMSLIFRVLDKQMHVTCNCKSMRSLKKSLMPVIYILGFYHKHTICFIGHAA